MNVALYLTIKFALYCPMFSTFKEDNKREHYRSKKK